MDRDRLTGLSRLAIASVVLVIPAAAAASPEGPQPRVPWKIVYEHYDQRIGESGAGIDIVTSERRRPLSLERRPRGSDTNYSEPALSPDGRHIAYIRSASDRELYVIRASGGERRRLAVGVIGGFVWSADSLSLAVTLDCAYPSEGGCRKGRIDIVSRDGTQRRVFVRPRDLGRKSEIELYDWSRRGDLLYVVRYRGREQLYTAGRAGPAALASRREDGDFGEASWSSDAQLVAYTRRCTDLRSDTYCDVAVMTRKGESKRTLVRRGPLTGNWGAPSYEAPTWVSGSQRMLVSFYGFDAHTRLVHATTGASRLYSRAPLWDPLAVSSDGRRVASIEREYTVADRLIIKSVEGSTLERVRLTRDFDAGSHDHDIWIG